MVQGAYSWEVRESAEELYIIDGQTYDQVAEATGVSIAQLKRWGTESVPSWTERKKEYRQTQTSIRYMVMQAKAKLIESVITTDDTQKAYAFRSVVESGRLLDQEALDRVSAMFKKDDTSDKGKGTSAQTIDQIRAAIMEELKG